MVTELASVARKPLLMETAPPLLMMRASRPVVQPRVSMLFRRRVAPALMVMEGVPESAPRAVPPPETWRTPPLIVVVPL